VLDCLLRGKPVIPGVQIIGERIGSRGVVLAFDAETIYAVGVGSMASDVLVTALQDVAWLKGEESLVRAAFPQAARPLSGVLLVADLFPPAFLSLLPLLALPCRLFRSIALGDTSSPNLFFEPYPPQLPERRTASEGTTEEEERFFSSW
jgi:hypothetical protein